MTQEHSTDSRRDFLGKWEAHFDRMQKSDSLGKSEKEEILSGLKKLREVFDDAWLWENAGMGFIHPLTSKSWLRWRGHWYSHAL